MAVGVKWLMVFVCVISINYISNAASEAKNFNSSPKQNKSTHPLKKSKPHHNLPEQKSYIKKSGMAFEETSTENIKSRLDKSLGVFGPWKQNAGDLYMGGITLKGQERLLNQPIRPIMRVNGYPINPAGSMSLTQLTDGTLDSDLELPQQTRAQSRYWPRAGNNRGNWFRGMTPQSINLPESRGSMSQSILDRLMFGNMAGGHKRGKIKNIIYMKKCIKKQASKAEKSP